MVSPQIPATSGSYFLVFCLPNEQFIQIGKFGYIKFSSGLYTYAGSAFGKGGLKARISHHLGFAKKQQWHLDWIRPSLTFLFGWYSLEINNECIWSAVIQNLPGSQAPLKKMGASDCSYGCEAHFYRLPDKISLEHLEKYLYTSQEHELHRFC